MAYILNTEGNLFVQTELSEVPAWLTCAGVGDINVPQGDKTPIYCPDPLNSGQYKIEGFVTGDVGQGTTVLEKPLVSVWNWLVETKCSFQARINWVCRGNRRDEQNYEVAALMLGAEFNSKGITNPVRTPTGTSDRVLTNGNVDFTTLMMIYRLTLSQHTLTNTADANGVYFLPERCEDRCGAARALCEHGIIGCDNPSYPGYLYDAEIKKTTDGTTWTATATDPFAYAGAVKAVWIFESVDGERYVACRQTPVAGHQAESAYSLDRGDTWVNVVMGGLLDQGVNSITLCAGKIVAVGTTGYIWESLDQASSWAVMAGPVAPTAEDLNDVDFYDDRQGYAVGDNNTFLYTNDASNWFAGTGPAAGADLLSVAVNMKGHVFVTTNDGRIFVSEDEGDSWAVRLNLGAGTIPWIEFEDIANYVGAFVHNPASGRAQLYRSENGGASWNLIAGMPNNSGLNWGHMCDQNHIITVGNAHGGTTFVVSTSPSL
jgi:photosystem II stability/assembly factor-like uncharacterized protein